MSPVRVATFRDEGSCDPRACDIDGDGQPLFSVVDELRKTKRYEFFKQATSSEIGKPFTISSCPTALRRSLGHVQARTFTRPGVVAKPGIYALTYAALEHGLQTLGGSEDAGTDEHPAVAAIRRATEAMEAVKWPDKEIRRVVHDAAAAASYTERLLPGGSHGKWNIRLPADCLRDLGGLSADLGIDQAQTAVLCLLWTLANERVELQDQCEEFAQTCAAFLERARLRADIIMDLIGGRTLARRQGTPVKVRARKGKR